MTGDISSYDTVIVGAGPAGSGLLINAMMRNRHAELLKRGVLWADQGSHMGPGKIGSYAISSDTMSKVFIECLVGQNNPLRVLQDDPAARLLSELNTQPVALEKVGVFLQKVGSFLENVIASSAQSDFWPQHKASSIEQHGDGRFTVCFSNGRQVVARKVVWAMGGWCDFNYAASATLAPGVSLSTIPSSCRLTSHELLEHGGWERVKPWLAKATDPRVIILGSSHSALSAAALLMRTFPGDFAAEGSITMMCRRPPKLFYPGAKEAIEDGYTAFNSDDICPVTDRVFRLAGLRLESRELYRRMLGLGDGPKEKRVRLLRFEDQSPLALTQALALADGVVTAFGYRPTTLPLMGADGAPCPLRAQVDRTAPLVNAQSEVLGADGEPIRNLFALGLASGFVPRGAVLGGEASFIGQTNGLWLYQHDLGKLIVDRIMGDSAL